jgi:hypothetical protein
MIFHHADCSFAKPFLAGFQKFFFASIKLGLVDSTISADFWNRTFTAYGFHDNNDLLFGGEYPTGSVADALYKVLCRGFLLRLFA